MVGGFATLASLSLPLAASAATAGTDNAGNYTSGWTNGSNGGTGFGAWDLTNNNDGTSHFAGYFLGDSSAGAGNINTGGQSFAIYANPSSAYAVASRAFAGTLDAGQVFSIQLAASYTNGSKGINLLNSDRTQVFNFSVGDGSLNNTPYSFSYKDSNGTTVPITAFSYHPDAVFALSYTQTSASTGAVTVTETSASASSSVSFTDTFSTTDALASFQLFDSNTDNGANQNNLYFNNLAVAVPEPATVLGGFLLVGSGVFVSNRRRCAA